jgi:regulation of enolase protein 1 (concanavalin A-like superfamily)
VAQPSRWRLGDDGLWLQTRDRTDFWRHTHYGFVRDDGHFLHVPAPAAFTAVVTFEGRYETLYDQAGMMLRLGETHWVKLDQHFDGMTFSIVVTSRQLGLVRGQPVAHLRPAVGRLLNEQRRDPHFLRRTTWQRCASPIFPTATRRSPMPACRSGPASSDLHRFRARRRSPIRCTPQADPHAHASRRREHWPRENSTGATLRCKRYAC